MRKSLIVVFVAACLLGAWSGAAGGIMTWPVWSFDWEGAYTDSFGEAMANAGDVNGDGYDDLLVGMRYYTVAGQPGTNHGRAALFLGSADGPSLEPVWESSGDAFYRAEFGRAVAGAGDVNGDGYDDILIGAPYWGLDYPDHIEGKVYLYYGSETGPGDAPAWTARSDQPGTAGGGPQLGIAVAGAGDVNGDGYDDILIGAASYEGAGPGDGLALVFHGSPSGPVPDGTPANADWTATVSGAGARLGRTVAGAGDVNGDGYDDVLLGAPLYQDGFGDDNEGLVLVYLGGPGGLGPDGTLANAHWTAESNQRSGDLGEALSSAGDVNGDGYDEVLVGCPGWRVQGTAEGRVFLWLGGPAGLGPAGTPTNADWVAGGLHGLTLGESVGGLGDVNGDGYDDIVVGHTQLDSATDGDLDGRLLGWFGGPPGQFDPSGLGFFGSIETVDWQVTGDELATKLGFSVAAGDYDGDGFRDTAAGSRRDGDSKGRALMFAGACGSTDADGDGLAAPADPLCAGQPRVDCDETDAAVWGTPGEVRDLRAGTGGATLEWTVPARPGAAGPALRYDVIRSPDPENFLGPAVCVESDDASDTQAVDADAPPAGTSFFYLVRAENDCPAGAGTLGTDSAGFERVGAACP